MNDGYGLKVNLRENPGSGVQVLQDVNGVPVRVEVTGPIRKRCDHVAKICATSRCTGHERRGLKRIA